MPRLYCRFWLEKWNWTPVHRMRPFHIPRGIHNWYCPKASHLQTQNGRNKGRAISRLDSCRSLEFGLRSSLSGRNAGTAETLLRLAKLELTLNCFSWAENYYKLINGVAMGTKMGPSYANLFIGYIEHQSIQRPQIWTLPSLHRRLCATSSTREELNQFITAVNSFHPFLKYT